MSVTLPLTFRASPLPSDFRGTPQEFLNAIVARLSVDTSADSYTIITSGSVLPTSNQGPFLLNGEKLYVWDVGTGAYIPQILDSLSLKYIFQQTAPDHTKYVIWFVINVNGRTIDIRCYDPLAAVWVSVFTDTFALYSTTVAMNTAITTATNLKYSFRGDSGADQDIVFAAPGTQGVDIGLVETFDPNSVFASSAFTAPVNGYYHFAAKVHLEVVAGTPTGNGIIFSLKKSGAVMGNEQVFYPDAGLAGRTMDIATIIQLNVGDVIKARVDVTIGGATGTWRVVANNTFLSGHLIQASA